MVAISLKVKSISKAFHQTIVISVILILLLGSFSSIVVSDPADPWWNENWNYRKQITIDHTVADETLSDFPVLIDISAIEFKNHAQSNGNDFVFTNAAGSVVYGYEIELYDASTGHLIAWVNITSLSSVTDNIFYIYYGNGVCGPQQNVASTWTDGFNGVYHLKETWDLSPGHFKDSTINHQDGTLVDANGNASSDSGRIGNGFRFDGATGYPVYINLGAINKGAPITFSCWMKADTITKAHCALGRYYGGYFLGTSTAYSGSLRKQILVNNNWAYYNWRSGVSSNVWYLMTVTYDGNTIRYYTNGTQDASTAVTGSLSLTTYPWHIGDDGSNELFFKGVVDEVRIANTCFSSGWISTYYRNINNPSLFYSLGTEEQNGIVLTLTTSGSGGGSIQASPAGPYSNGTVVTVWANASVGSTFTGFTGDLTGTTTPQTIVMNGNKVVNATFTLKEYTLTLQTSGNGTGSLQASPQGPFHYGTMVTVYANASAGSTFSGFTGDLTGTTTPQTLYINGNKSVTAAFTLYGGFPLTLIANGTGTGTIQASPGPYTDGKVVTIWANATVGSRFSSFFGDLSGATTPQTLTIHGPTTVTAQFTRNVYTLSLTISGTGTGTIQANPPGPYYYGTVITVWANASVESVFSGFSGSLTGTTTPQTFTIQSNASVNAAFTQSNPEIPGNWWNTNWLYRTQITILHTSVSQNLANFPVLIDITSIDLKNHAQASANDVAFTNQSGAIVYPYELDSYDAATGRLIAWVNVNNLSTTTDTILYLYYGNSICGPLQNGTGTWNSAFNGVYHLRETRSTATGHFKDSTANHQDGTLTDANANTSSDNGIVGKGYRFNGGADGSTSDFINIGAINKNAPITFSCWIKADAIAAARCALGRYYGGYYLGTSSASGGRLRDQILVNNNWGYYNWRSGVSSNVWYLLTVTYDGSAIRYYTNDAQDASSAVSGSLSSPTYTWHIGDDGSAGKCFKGVVDEVRIANACLSSGWISAYYQNVNDPSSFYLIGIEETQRVYTLTLTTSGSGSGTIQASPAGPYMNGAVVTVWANASAGSIFAGFSGNLTGSTTPQLLTIHGNATVNAAFTLPGVGLTVTPTGNGNGVIQVSPAGPYHYGDVVTVWANASSGSVFTGFTGDMTGDSPLTFTLQGYVVLTAEFMLINGPYILTLTQNGTGWGNIEASNLGPFSYGEIVTIWANASVGSHFDGFTGSVTGTTTPQTLTIHGNTYANAEFTSNGPFFLTLSMSGTGTGTIFASSPGPYYYGDAVTIWANSSAYPSYFKGFTGNLTGTTTPQVLIIHGDSTVNAVFDSPGPNNWWNSNWPYRKTITISHALISQDLTNFPILINITSIDLKNHAQSSGNDIAFADQTGHAYKYELESYDASNGRLIAWVNVTSLSSTSDTILYLYYGNGAAGPQQNVAGTWNSAFNGVYHLKETWSTAAGHFKDSTENHQDGTLTDANANSSSDNGAIGKGFRFNGGASGSATTDFINIGVINHNYPLTYSCWVKAESFTSSRCALGRYYGSYFLGTSSVSGGMLREQIFVNNNWQYYNWRSGVSSNVWYLMTVTYDGSTIRYYTNSVQDASVAVTGSLSMTSYAWHIGDTGSAELGFKGVVDEVRILNACLSNSWISAYYQNVNNPSAFYTVGSQESQSGVTPTISNPQPANGSSNNVFDPYLQVDVYDADGDAIFATLSTNASGSWQTLTTTTFINGSGTLIGKSTDMQTALKTYWWRVRITDGYYWSNKTYWFTTGVNQPVVLDSSPLNNVVTTFNPRLRVNVVDYQNKLLTVKFRRQNGSAWQTMGTYTGYGGIFYHNTSGMDATSTTYRWSYNISDGTTWVNASFTFTAQAFVLKWTNYDVALNTVGPVAADINNDGIYEIFQVGEGKVICVNGLTGATIWTYTDNQIAQHSIPALGDLDNDGIPELVISCDESQAGIVGKTLALRTTDGSVFWRVTVPADHRHLVIADTDGTGYPYVFVVAHVEHGYISKLRGTDGTVVLQTRVYYPCHGGLSMADLDNDGHIELLLADYNGEPGKGIQCYDADTLQLKWFVRNRADPQLSVAADVNKDGVLDIITSKYPSGPLSVIDGATATNIPGYNALNSPTHSPVTVYDIDGDGNLEALVCQESQVMVFDLTTKTLEITLSAACDEPPFMADVIGDMDLEIIAAGHGSVTIYDKNYQNVGHINNAAERWTLVQDIDYDGQNELVTDTGGDGILRAFETSAYTPIPHVRTTTYGYSEQCTGAGIYTPPPGAPQPVLKQESPANGSLDLSFNPTLGIYAIEYQVHNLSHNRIVDYKYDKMNITVSTNASGSWQTLATFTAVGNGFYNVTTSGMNHLDTTYYWKVTAVDIDPKAEGISTTALYHFTTKSAPKIHDIGTSPINAYQHQNVTFIGNISEDVHMDVTKLCVTGPADYTPVNLTVYQNQWTPLTFDSFETGLGNYVLGGSKCIRFFEQNPTDDVNTWPLVPQGSWGLQLQGNANVNSSFSLATPLDLATPGYTGIKVDFTMNSYRLSDGSKYYLEYFDGAKWVIRKTYTQNNGVFSPSYYNDTNYKFANWINYHDSVWINKSNYNFPMNANIRFRSAFGNTGNVTLDQIYINATVVQPSPFTLKHSFTLLGTYTYSFWCRDVNGNTNSSGTSSFTVSVDTVSPQITSVTATPSTAYQGAIVNVSCTAHDNAELHDVCLVITDPNAVTTNVSILGHFVSPDTYYFTQVFTTLGTYQYHVWVKDVNGYTAISGTYSFTVVIPPLADWQYRRQITIDHTQVNASQTNFPVVISFQNDPDLAAKALDNFNDLLFTDSSVSWVTGYSTDRLAHEIESSNGVTGNLTVWVKVPLLSSTQDTVLYMYYSNAMSLYQQQPTQVWNDNFNLVQHLNETSGTAFDSTAYNNDGTPQSTINQSAVGKIDGADWFNGVRSLVHINNASSINLGSTGMISAWIKLAVYKNYGGIIHKGDLSSYTDEAYGLQLWNNSKLRFYVTTTENASSYLETTENLTNTTWCYVVASWNATGRYLYVNGILDTINASAMTPRMTSGGLNIGAQITQSGYYGFNGAIDEVILSSISRGTGWVNTCYLNQANPSSFCAVGPEQTH